MVVCIHSAGLFSRVINLMTIITDYLPQSREGGHLTEGAMHKQGNTIEEMIAIAAMPTIFALLALWLI